MLPEYRERVNAPARKANTLSLGPYRLDEFNTFYAALIAVCAAHDFLCFRWGQLARTYPIESAVMVRPAAEWRDVLSGLSGMAANKCQAMLADLTFSVRQSVDLHVYEWLPVEGRDFVVRFDRATVNGVSIESRGVLLDRSSLGRHRRLVDLQMFGGGRRCA